MYGVLYDTKFISYAMQLFLILVRISLSSPIVILSTQRWPCLDSNPATTTKTSNLIKKSSWHRNVDDPHQSSPVALTLGQVLVQFIIVWHR